MLEIFPERGPPGSSSFGMYTIPFRIIYLVCFPQCVHEAEQLTLYCYLAVYSIQSEPLNPAPWPIEQQRQAGKHSLNQGTASGPGSQTKGRKDPENLQSTALAMLQDRDDGDLPDSTQTGSAPRRIENQERTSKKTSSK